MQKLLIANRGEIAIRIARTAALLGLPTVGVHSEDDAASLHVRRCDEAFALPGLGPAAYLNASAIVALALREGADAVHPGYGFLSESAAFAQQCADARLTFVGPTPATLEAFGDKAMARAIAQRCGVPTLDGLNGATSLAEAEAFLRDLGPGGAVMVKAIAGGGGRGMRPVTRVEDLAPAFERCASEALAAFGSGDLYVERLLPRARHIEVQILGDGSGEVVHLWDRDCSAQRQRQKVVEFAPALWLDPAVRARLLSAAVELGRAVDYRGVGTIEFLVDADGGDGFAFIEANARLQVEHTVTEAVTGLDLVQLQLEVAGGRTLTELGLAEGPPPCGASPCRRGSIWSAWARTALRGRPAATSPSMSRRRARGSAWMGSAMRATTPASGSTRSWPR